MTDETRQSPTEAVSHATCADCQGAGYFYRIPRSMNPFSASIEVTARAMRRIECPCKQLNTLQRPEGRR